jgi:hypothetical protein
MCLSVTTTRKEFPMRFILAALCALLLSSSARAEDTAAPVVEHTPIKFTERGAKFVQVFAKITDESKIFPQVFFRYGPGEYQKPLDLKVVKGMKDQWGANIPVKGDLCEYYIEAYDELGNGPGRAGDPDKPFRVDTSGQGGLLIAEAPKPAPAPAPKAAALPPPPPPRAIPAPAPPPPLRQTAQASSGRTWTWIVGGVGLGALAGGLIAGNEMKSADKVYTNSLVADPGASYSSLKAQYDANKSLGQKATVLTIAGGVLLAAGVALFFIEGGSKGGSGGDGAIHF